MHKSAISPIILYTSHITHKKVCVCACVTLFMCMCAHECDFIINTTRLCTFNLSPTFFISPFLCCLLTRSTLRAFAAFCVCCLLLGDSDSPSTAFGRCVFCLRRSRRAICTALFSLSADTDINSKPWNFSAIFTNKEPPLQYVYEMITRNDRHQINVCHGSKKMIHV